MLARGVEHKCAPLFRDCAEQRVQRGALPCARRADEHEAVVLALCEAQREAFRARHPKLAPAKAAALADLERAVLLAELSPNLAALAPEVLVNVARAAPGAVSLRDVAAVPGRLARVGGRLVARRRPRYGASRHLAEVLLASGYAACINVRYDEEVERALGVLGLEKFVFSSEEYREPNPAAAAVREAREQGKLPRVAVDIGGRGVEPVTYIFGGSAVEVVLAAEQIARLVKGQQS